MRKIIAGMFITLDGVVEAPEKWNPPYYDDELNQDVMPLLAAAGTHLYGRRSYELFRGVFTGPAAPPHAGLMTATPKVVVSTTLTNPDWGPTSVISSNITAAVTELKQQPGQDISVGASATLVRFLLAEHLLDELRLLVHPVVAGTGKRLFAETGSRVPLTLLESRPHRNGIMTPLRTRRGGGQGPAGIKPWLMRSSTSPGWRRSMTS
jgi:dihydrofolate reductase